ncbi:MAG: hypothetical protein IPG50_19195 [Myxococcales bacterium]|nr:hypothetical protein [Myxococcales bacterium]
MNRGLDKTEIADLGEIYRLACGGGVTPKDCNNEKPTFNQLRLAAATYYGTSPGGLAKASRFLNEGLANGINH